MIPLAVSDPAKLIKIAKKLKAARIGLEIKNLNGDLLMEIAKAGLWPKAAQSHSIVTTEQQKRQRATAIVTQMLRTVNGLRCLDFGCGEGHVVREMAKQGAKVIGYDPHHKDSDVQTRDWKNVNKQGPYDKILVYDVIDHIPRDKWQNTIDLLKGSLKLDGKIYIRFHPFSSIHGTHLYNSANLAYAHLCFSDKQIGILGGKQQKAAPVYTPLLTYRGLLKETKLKILNEAKTTIELPDFFRCRELNDYLLPRFRKRGIEHIKEMHAIMEIAFVDYVVSNE